MTKKDDPFEASVEPLEALLKQYGIESKFCVYSITGIKREYDPKEEAGMFVLASSFVHEATSLSDNELQILAASLIAGMESAFENLSYATGVPVPQLMEIAQHKYRLMKPDGRRAHIHHRDGCTPRQGRPEAPRHRARKG